jgi:hypothetical protein
VRTRSEFTVDDGKMTTRNAARMAAFLLEMKGLLAEPSVRVDRPFVHVQWYTNSNLVPTGMWWPMLLSAWMSADRDLSPEQVLEARFRLEQ